MRNFNLLLVLLLVSSVLFAQKQRKEKVQVNYIQLPNHQLSQVETYAVKWTPNVESEVLNDWNSLGLNTKMVKGFMRLSGFNYKAEDPDVTFNLVCNDLVFDDPTVRNIADDNQPANYRAIYQVTGDWKVEVSGKQVYTLDLSDALDKVEVMYPSKVDRLGASISVPSEEHLNKVIDANSASVEGVRAQLISKLADKINAYLNNELGYLKRTSEFAVYTFKSSKKMDMSAWDQPTLSALEMLKKLEGGENPAEIYKQYENVFTFWDAEFENGKSNLKENKKVLESSTRNLINTLLLVNPSAIKDEYLTVLDEFIFLRDIEERVAEAKSRQSANNYAELDFNALMKVPVLKNYYYPVNYETTKGQVKKGMIEFSTPYYVNPWETGEFVKIYDLDYYNTVNGKVEKKQVVDLKAIHSYTLFGEKFVQMKYSDPSVLSIGAPASFLEEIIIGNASAYKMYSMEAAETNGMVVDLSKGLSGQSQKQLAKSRMNPSIVVDYGKKPIAIHSYSKLAELFFDKKDVSMKIAEGKYGNKPLKVKDAKSGKFSGGRNVNNETVLQIISDYNAL